MQLLKTNVFCDFKWKRSEGFLCVASISLDASFATSLTAACAMKSTEGVYVADKNAVFPIYFYREKRYLDAGAQVQIPTFDSISSILIEPHQMILGSVTGGLLHLSFEFSTTFEHFVIASSVLAHPISSGAIKCIRLLGTGDSLLALHCTDTEVVISEKEHERWNRITSHTGGAHAIAVTPFNVEEGGAFAVVGSEDYVRLKMLQFPLMPLESLKWAELAENQTLYTFPLELVHFLT
uniref:MMS1_N domain-containing protein n=2 Tax=Caenorhabditis tropicalis TaxID=1561998 RepID=A0A1I7TEQ3_9PELO